MTYKEFNSWCNKRASDGCWGVDTAIFCIDIINQVKKQPFWMKEKKWQEINAKYYIQDNIVDIINKKIIEIYGTTL